MQLVWAKAILLIWAASLLIWLALGADMVFRSATQDRAAATAMARLHLTAPAYYPAGHPQRHPEYQNQGISAGHTPLLPFAPTHHRLQFLPDALNRWETHP